MSKEPRTLTREDLLSNPEGSPTAGELLDLLALEGAALLRRAADELREPTLRPELRRLLAWRLEAEAERLENPPEPRKGRPPAVDVDLARRFLALREGGATFEQATAALSLANNPQDRTPYRHVKRATAAARRRLREFGELVEAATEAMTE